MTVGRSIMLKTVALLLGLMFLAGAALAGISALQQNHQQWQQRDKEISLLHMVGLEVAAAQDALSAPPYRLPTATVRLAEARSRLTQLLSLELWNSGPDHFQEPSRRQMGHHVQTLLEQASNALSSGVPSVGTSGGDSGGDSQLVGVRTDLQLAYTLLAQLSQQASDHLQDIQLLQHRQVRFTFIIIGTLAGLIFLVAMGIGIWQYRSVMGPLTRLAHGVRHIAHGRFDQRLPITGPAELAQVASDFNRMAEELDNLYRQLEQKVATKSRELVRSERLASVGFLAAGVAHEINNPLGIIAGYAEATVKSLADHPASPASQDPLHTQTVQALRIISDEAFRCKAIIQRLLTLARPGSDSRERVSLVQIAGDVVALVAGLQRYRQRQLILDPSTDPWIVIADQNEMKQVLLNLVINALDAVPDGAGVVHITGQNLGQTVQITVCDNGKGMTPATAERVFEPFFSQSRRPDPGPTPGPTSGTGLGLSIVHAIVQAHGGTIHAHSDGLGQGSRFTIILPAAPQDSPS